MPKKNFSCVEDYLKWFVAKLPEVRVKLARHDDRPDYFALRHSWYWEKDWKDGRRCWCCGYMYEEAYDGIYWEDGLSAGHDDPLGALRILKERVEEFLAK